jgi:hypothetical protein
MCAESIRALVQSECQCDANVFGAAFFDQHAIPVAGFACELARRLRAKLPRTIGHC